MDQYLPQFIIYLQSQHYSGSTIRNYLADIHHFLNSKLEAQDYLRSISSDPNYKRYYSSLKLFYKFALDQRLVVSTPISTPTDYLDLFKKHLEKKKTPISTIRNYINDLNQYISWLKNLEN